MVFDEKIPLDPDCTVRFLVWPGNTSRYLRLFVESWNQIPPDCRECLADFWNTRDPTIEFSNMWQDHETTLGQVRGGGRHMTLNAKKFDLMPDNVAKAIIGHEVAHVYQWATNTINPVDSNEERADELARKWKFDVFASKAWRNEQQNREFDYNLFGH